MVKNGPQGEQPREHAVLEKSSTAGVQEAHFLDSQPPANSAVIVVDGSQVVNCNRSCSRRRPPSRQGHLLVVEVIAVLVVEVVVISHPWSSVVVPVVNLSHNPP